MPPLPPTTSDLLRRAADLLDRRPDISPIAVDLLFDQLEIQARGIPADIDSQIGAWVTRGDYTSRVTRATIDGVKLVFVELRNEAIAAVGASDYAEPVAAGAVVS